MENKGLKLIVVGSSSRGNCYALDSGDEILLLEAGVRYSTMQKAINYKTDKIVGVCISHAHG